MGDLFFKIARCCDPVYERAEVLTSQLTILRERCSEVGFAALRSTILWPTIFVCRINVKRGGINTIPEPRSVPILTDPSNPTIVMGVSIVWSIGPLHYLTGIYRQTKFTHLLVQQENHHILLWSQTSTQRVLGISRIAVCKPVDNNSSQTLRIWPKYGLSLFLEGE